MRSIWMGHCPSNIAQSKLLLLMFVVIEWVNAASTQRFRRERKRKYQYLLSRPITGQVHGCHALLSTSRLPQLMLVNCSTRSKNASGNNQGFNLRKNNHTKNGILVYSWWHFHVNIVLVEIFVNLTQTDIVQKSLLFAIVHKGVVYSRPMSQLTIVAIHQALAHLPLSMESSLEMARRHISSNLHVQVRNILHQ